MHHIERETTNMYLLLGHFLQRRRAGREPKPLGGGGGGEAEAACLYIYIYILVLLLFLGRGGGGILNIRSCQGVGYYALGSSRRIGHDGVEKTPAPPGGGSKIVETNPKSEIHSPQPIDPHS